MQLIINADEGMVAKTEQKIKIICIACCRKIVMNYIAISLTLFLAFLRVNCHSMVTYHDIQACGGATNLSTLSAQHKKMERGISQPILGAPWVQMVPRVLQTHASDDRVSEPSS
jgi:hypothetical protein